MLSCLLLALKPRQHVLSVERGALSVYFLKTRPAVVCRFATITLGSNMLKTFEFRLVR